MSTSAEHMSQQDLESYLWGAAKLLRGLIDAGDYKQYVFPLLFFKRLSDVWDEEYQRARDETGNARATADDRFVIPDGAHWSDVRSASRDVGRALLDAFRAIEAANPERLNGVFGNASWTDKAQMPDETLKNLIEHFSQHTLSLAKVPEDELGNGYEYLIKQFADDSGHTAQEFYTNRTLVHLMTQMLEPQPGDRIYDPTAGTAGMLISSLAEVKRRGGDARTLGLYGQELIHITAAIARMNLLVALGVCARSEVLAIIYLTQVAPCAIIGSCFSGRTTRQSPDRVRASAASQRRASPTRHRSSSEPDP